MYEENVLTECQWQNWFAKFRYIIFDAEDSPHSERLAEADKIKH